MWRNTPISFLTVKQYLNIAITSGMKQIYKYIITIPFYNLISKINSMTNGNLELIVLNNILIYRTDFYTKSTIIRRQIHTSLLKYIYR